MTQNGQKFATASLKSEDTKGFTPDPLTLDDIVRLRTICESTFSDLWWDNGNGQLLNKFNYIVATFEQKTDATAMAAFSPEILMQLIDLAEKALKQAPAKKPATKVSPEE